MSLGQIVGERSNKSATQVESSEDRAFSLGVPDNILANYVPVDKNLRSGSFVQRAKQRDSIAGPISSMTLNNRSSMRYSR
jgi:hypothetical protein